GWWAGRGPGRPPPRPPPPAAPAPAASRPNVCSVPWRQPIKPPPEHKHLSKIVDNQARQAYGRLSQSPITGVPGGLLGQADPGGAAREGVLQVPAGAAPEHARSPGAVAVPVTHVPVVGGQAEADAQFRQA